MPAPQECLQVFDEVYCLYNRREYVPPDPLQFLYSYPDIEDREIVGLIAAMLAFGRVEQIIKSVGIVLDVLGHHPRVSLLGLSDEELSASFFDFRHRWVKGPHVVALLRGIKATIEEHDSLQRAFASSLSLSDGDLLQALSLFANDLIRHARLSEMSGFIPDPGRESACKRWHLYLRWMVRADEVDPGGWDSISPSKLLIPLDTHMFRLGRTLGWISHKAPDQKAAVELTRAFQVISPKDPVRYDFSLTRWGIRRDLDFSELLRRLDVA
ncbi:TIGR02757 family protein [Acetomicrobium sp. S15 = DSM 107314]|uniref:TIGR02757 family protein n=1 Tax=Acetomicrobium sp. S15 = DSM 107314 TaxID=2529858 RepID=UPI0018E0E1DE|nr:TIGR02757 family protein [Acetomicrobium sp. S15 = DSM 107314]